MLRRRLMGLGAVAVAAVAAAPAQAQVRSERCTGEGQRGAQCGVLPVPLDHADPASPRIDLAFARFRATGSSSQGTIVFLAGGPGQAAVADAGSIVGGELRPLRRSFDVVVVDQRGTGASSPLRCSTAPRGVFRVDDDASPAEVARAVATCGAELGAARRHFSTYATVLDVEALRAALGIERIVPLGVSYGGQVAGDYARRFPERTQAVVLDSTSPVEGIETLGTLPQLALPRVLREVCFPPGCERILGDPAALLRAAVARLSRGPLRGRYVTPGGRTRTASVGLADLYTLVRSSDADPALRTALPAAFGAAARGDAAPLLRLGVAGSGGGGSSVNEVRFLATACTEGDLPWEPESDPATRPELLANAIAARAARYAPFPADVVGRQATATECLGWPATERPPFPPSVGTGQGPQVPVLVLAGRDDLRTPLEDQRRAAAQFPGTARVVAVPNAGHSVLSSDLTGCAQETLRRFLTGDELGTCARRTRTVPLALPVFRDLEDVPGAAGDLPRRVEQAATAVDLTLRDVDRQVAALEAGSAGSAAEQRDSASVSVGGLRGGRLTVGERRIRLRAYEVVTGVRLTGELRRGGGELVVSGRVAGALRVLRSGTLQGVLAGTRITYRPAAVGA